MNVEEIIIKRYKIELSATEVVWLKRFCETGNLGSGLDKVNRKNLIHILKEFIGEEGVEDES